MAKPDLCPPLDDAVIRWLERKYPPKPAKPGDTVEALFFAGGAHSVVVFLRHEYERQQESNVYRNAKTKEAGLATAIRARTGTGPNGPGFQ